MTDNPKGSPRLSVVVIVLGGAAPLRRCLNALAPQLDGAGAEVIVPCDAAGEAWREQIGSQFPWVQLLPLPGTRTPAERRAVGIAKSRAPVVVITEDHCVPRAGWCQQVLAQHGAWPAAAIGGAVEKLSPDSALNWSFYFADYVRYANPVGDGEAHHLTDCNVSYKRAAIDAVAEVWKTEFHENVVHGALERRGEKLRVSSEIAVDQQRSLEAGAAIWDRYAFGRLFASTRVQTGTIAQRFVFIATSPLVPVLLVLRSFGHVRRTGRFTGEFLRALGWIVLFSCCWAFGEFTGYVTGTPEKRLSAQRG